MCPRSIPGRRRVGMSMVECALGGKRYTVEPRPSWVCRLLLLATKRRRVSVHWTMPCPLFDLEVPEEIGGEWPRRQGTGVQWND